MQRVHGGAAQEPPVGSRELLSPLPQLPQAPSPSRDPGVAPHGDDSSGDAEALHVAEDVNIFEIAPVAALKMLSDMIEVLVCLTGDVPPTPPVAQSSTRNLGLIQAEKENVARHLRERHHSRQNSASSLKDFPGNRQGPTLSLREIHESQQGSNPLQTKTSSSATDNEDQCPKTKTPPISSPELGLFEPVYAIDSASSSSLNLQHGFIVRKFYSKKPPPTSLEDYLHRLHQFCPMSTGVYLATSLYIHRLAIVERIIPVTVRNAHRLVLAGLRVSMKKLEDQKYRHSRFARVGGVSEAELGKLEVSFCFLTNFDLKANEVMLTRHVRALKDGTALLLKNFDFQPVLPPPKETMRMVVGRVKPNG